MSWIFWPMFVAASSFTVELPDSSNAKSPPDGILDGLPVDGKPVGRVLGESDKVVEGRIDGTREGPTLGKLDGLLDGDKLGFKDGIVEGDSDGTTEGTSVGKLELLTDGSLVGAIADGKLGAPDLMAIKTTLINPKADSTFVFISPPVPSRMLLLGASPSPNLSARSVATTSTTIPFVPINSPLKPGTGVNLIPLERKVLSANSLKAESRLVEMTEYRPLPKFAKTMPGGEMFKSLVSSPIGSPVLLSIGTRMETERISDPS